MTTNPIERWQTMPPRKLLSNHDRECAKELAKRWRAVFKSLGVGPIETPIYGKTELSDEAAKSQQDW
jgi:hypothetical protein